MESHESHKTSNTALYIVLAILILSVIGNIYLFSASKKKEKNLGSRIDSLVTVRVNLQQELTSASNEITQYKGVNARLDSVVNEANSKIALQEEKINEMIRKEGNFTRLNKKLQGELEELKKLREEYLEKIDGLVAENQQLKQRNDSLNTTVSTLNEAKTSLEQKVSTASRLKIEYINVNTFKKKGDDKFLVTSMAKKTDKVIVCFSVLDNKVAEKGDHKVFIRIQTPDGKTLGDRSQGSKEFKNKDTGEDMLYTMEKVITYNNEAKNMCAGYSDDSKTFIPGKYNVEFYVDGMLTNKTNFELK
jgi:hypothetical protein